MKKKNKEFLQLFIIIIFADLYRMIGFSITSAAIHLLGLILLLVWIFKYIIPMDVFLRKLNNACPKKEEN